MIKKKPQWHVVYCDICKRPLERDWCTTNVCEECCQSGRCPKRGWCKAYPGMQRSLKEDKEKRVVLNPSKRVKL